MITLISLVVLGQAFTPMLQSNAAVTKSTTQTITGNKTFSGTTTLSGSTSAAGTITSSVASGSNAIALSVAGARIDVGPAANDYWHATSGYIDTPSLVKAAELYVNNGTISAYAAAGITLNGNAAAAGNGLVVDNATSITSGTIATFKSATVSKATIDGTGMGTFNGGIKAGTAAGANKISFTGRGSAVVDFASSTAECRVSSNITVTGSTLGDGCVVGFSSAPESTGSFTCEVTAADTVVVKFCTPAAAIDPASRTYTVTVLGAQ